MNLKYSYWYFKQALSSKVCDDMIKYGKSFQDGLAKIGGHEGDTAKINIKNLKKKRNSNIVWLNDPWIYNQIHPYVHMANKNAGWNFDWDYSESCQFTKYNKKQFYGWHRDSWEIPYHEPNNPRRHNKIRKLSVTISLSGPEDYKGGNLEFNLNKGDLSELDEFEGFCYSNLHRYIINTQKVLYNVSQGRFFDKTDIPKNKWKDKWSQKTFIW